MRLTVLGSGAACAAAGDNSSGYLIEDSGVRILLDCGHGVASALVGMMPANEIDHVLVSHMHADHFIDLLPLRFAACKDMAGFDSRQTTVHLPPGGKETLARLLELVCFPPDFFENVWDLCEYQTGQTYQLTDSVTARFAGGVHYIPGWAIRIDGSASITYTGDTAPSTAVCQLAMGSDLVLAEATLDEAEDGPVRGHLTALQAAELATAAGARRLMLTHFWYDADREAMAAEAQRCFPGRVLVASDGAVLEL